MFLHDIDDKTQGYMVHVFRCIDTDDKRTISLSIRAASRPVSELLVLFVEKIVSVTKAMLSSYFRRTTPSIYRYDRRDYLIHGLLDQLIP